MKRQVLIITVLLGCMACGSAGNLHEKKRAKEVADSASVKDVSKEVALEDGTEEEPVIKRLTEDDYREVAERLGVEVAAIKAVVDIEAGKSHEGFSAPGVPLINFDLTMFRKFAGKRGINLSKYQKSHSVVFSRPNVAKYGSQQAGQNARLKAARTIDNTTAIEGTFWGMFQIGGFNWKKCGASSIDEFVMLMSRSERDQLDMFANFLVSTGLDKHLKTKNWSAFSRGYNGPSYASRGYHTRMASAYARHKAKEK